MKALSHSEKLYYALTWLVFSFYLDLSRVNILFSYNASKSISSSFIKWRHVEHLHSYIEGKIG